MANSDDDKRATKSDVSKSDVIGFPQSRVRPPGGNGPFKDLGSTETMDKYELPEAPTTGHWCSRCHGIWFGYLLEVECPVCGSRDG